ncbi:MAG TPA: tetratricopeptide repeat protein [Terriglobales bacterium]|nr:tetratricopeptide repeat protein [Terriglobales bacterium]
MSKPAGSLYQFGPFCLDPQERLLARDGQALSVTPKAFDTLVFLVENNGHLVAKDTLMQAIWPDTFVEEVNLSQNVSLLRKVLGDTPQEQRYIQTVPGRGYRFSAPVRELGKSNADAEQVVLQSHTRSRLEVEEKKFPARVWWLAAVACLLAAGLLGYRSQRVKRQAAPVPPPVPARRSLAVLGFQNASGRVEDQWLSTGIREMLSTELAAGEQLRMVSGEDVARMKAELPWRDTDSVAKDTAARIRQDLGSDLLVAGSYAVVGRQQRQLRLDLRLQDARTGEILFEISETGTEDDLFELVAKAGTRLRQQLGLSQVSPVEAAELRTALPANGVAARLYAQGLEKLRAFEAPAARDLLLQAVRADLTYPLSHAALAETWSALGYDQNALQEARRAYQLSGRLSHADRLFVEASYWQAIKQWDKAIAIYHDLALYRPDEVEYGLRLAAVEISAGKGKDALATIADLRRLPLPVRDDARLDLTEAKAHESLGDYKQAINASRQAEAKGHTRGARLLLARALDSEAWNLQQIEGYTESISKAQQAKAIYAVTGDLSGAGASLRTIGLDLQYSGDFAGALAAYQEAIPPLQKIGDELDLAHVVNDEGVLYMQRGSLRQAKERYLKSEKTYAQISNKRGMALATANLANVELLEGNLATARHLYERVLVAFRETGDKYGYGLTLGNLGEVSFELGQLEQAKRMYSEALQVMQEMGDRSDSAMYFCDMGNVLKQQADFAGATKAYAESLSLRTQIGEKGWAAVTELAMAGLANHQGRATEADSMAARGQAELEKENRIDDEIQADAVRARSLLLQGKTQQAHVQVAHAASILEQTQTLTSHLEFEVTTAQVELASNNLSAAQARAERALAAARVHGLKQYQLESRLVLAEVELQHGRSALGQTHLKGLAAESDKQGFHLLAQEANLALKPDTVRP